jgi:hypothetical protein
MTTPHATRSNTVKSAILGTTSFGFAFRAFLLALVLRLIPFLAAHSDESRFFTHDSFAYHQYAVNLVERGVFSQKGEPPWKPDTERTPVYPLFLAGIYGVLGESVKAAILVQVVLGSFVPVLVFLLARGLEWPDGPGKIAALGIAIDPALVSHADLLMTETVYLLLFVVHLGFLAQRGPGRKWMSPALSGLLLGLAILTRPATVWWVLPSAIWLFWDLIAEARKRETIPPWKTVKAAPVSVLLFLIAVTVVTAPWVLRNRKVSGSAHLDPTLGINLFVAAEQVVAVTEGVPIQRAGETIRERSRTPLPDIATAVYTPEISQRYGEVSLRYLRTYPLVFAKNCAYNVLRAAFGSSQYPFRRLLLGESEGAGTADTRSVGGLLSHLRRMDRVGLLAWMAADALFMLLVYLAAVMGILRLYREGRLRLAILLAFGAVFFIVLASPIQTNIRFRIPSLPFIYLLAGCGAYRKRG